MAQRLVDAVVARYPDLLVVSLHVTPPGSSENVIVASNIGRIGKRADADDNVVLQSGSTHAKVNRNGDRFEVELVLHDAAQRPIGALAIVVAYHAADDRRQLVERAERIRDELAAQIPGVAALMAPATEPVRK